MSPSDAPAQPTYAAFPPSQAATAGRGGKAPTTKRSAILVHQKSPLLLATPPHLARALAYSHPFLLPLNSLAGLLTWSSPDPWESFLLLASFWAIVLYGDVVVRLAAPLVVVGGLIAGMYGRRFSPLSSSGWGLSNAAPPGPRPSTAASAASEGGPATGTSKPSADVTPARHQKTLDDMVDTLRQFAERCDVLMEPLLALTDFLSTQRTPTSATVRPALTTLFIRILLCSPAWFLLTLPPLRIITTKRIVLVVGTLVLSWHSKPMRVARAILWRSASVRRACTLLTGLDCGCRRPDVEINLGKRSSPTALTPESALTKALRNQAKRKDKDPAVKFTFILYENQRRWIGLGWTSNLFAYERAAWTDEHNNPVPPKDAFELPDVEDGNHMRWQWVPQSRWRVDGVSDDADLDTPAAKMGWVYYDNKWQSARRGVDGWGKWTRRRKWYRDAELVEADEEPANGPGPVELPAPAQPEESEPPPLPARQAPSPMPSPSPAAPASSSPPASEPWNIGRSFFKASTLRRRAAERPPSISAHSVSSDTRQRDCGSHSDAEGSLGLQVELELQGRNKPGSWGVGDDARMSLE